MASGGTVSLPAPSTGAKVRLQLRVGSATADDEGARIQGGQIVARVEADPGLYQLRAVSNDKARTPLGKEVSLLVPGIRRDAGVWNFNGSLWATKGSNPSATTTFLKGLSRDDKTKLPQGIPIDGNAPLQWQTLSAGTLQSWLSGNNSAALQTGWNEAQAAKRVLVGYEMSVGAGDLAKATRSQIRDALTSFRTASKAWAPNAALILSVDNSNPIEAAQQINLAAPFFDAIVLKWRPTPAFDSQLWALKNARRVVEEQPNFDLPLWVDVSGIQLMDAQLLELYQGGASGLLGAPDQTKPAWVKAWEQNANWVSGAATLEDVAIWPTGTPEVLRFTSILRTAGRVPLVGRLPGDLLGNVQSDADSSKSGESMFVSLDDNSTQATIRAIELGATNGATVYVEGLPAPALWEEMGRATGTNVEPLSAPRPESLKLDDPWVWGTIRGREFDVTQLAQITVKSSLAAKARDERGKAVETQPRSVASLANDPNGLLICPVGKGRILWLPHRFSRVQDGQINFYNAVAGLLQAALGTAFDAQKGVTLPVRLTWRMTPAKSSLLGVFNPTNNALDVPIMGRGNDAFAVNLLTGDEIKTTVRGYETQFRLTVPAHGYGWVALGETREIFDKERGTTTVKARLK